MHTQARELLLALELHSPPRIAAVLDAGWDPRALIEGRSICAWLTSMYTRSDAFVDCMRLLLARGAVLDDPQLQAVLLNDVRALRVALAAAPELPQHRTDLVCSFTPLKGVGLLHVAAEFGHLEVARELLAAGAEVDARAAVDASGLGGQSPLFHTVNANANRSAPVMELLLDAGANPLLRVDGLCWGEGFEWETTLLDLSPISYAQAGLLPQMHRDELQICANLKRLMQAAGRPEPTMRNVPNRYLKPSPG